MSAFHLSTRQGRAPALAALGQHVLLAFRTIAGLAVPLAWLFPLWIALSPGVRAYSVVQDTADGLHVTMTGSLDWAGFDRGKVISLEFNNVDMKDEDVLKIVGMPRLRHLLIGALPERVTLQCGNIAELGRLENLEQLKLCVSNPRKLPLDFVGKLKGLESFTMVCDELGEDFSLAAAIRKLPRLQNIDLACPGIADAHVDAITGACDLVRVRIRSDLMTDEAIRSIGGEAGLKEVDVASPLLTDAVGRILAESGSLESLSISSGKLTVEFIRQIQGLKKLKALSVSVEEGSAEVFAELRKIEGLESLEVVCASKSGFAMSRIASHPNLRRILIRGVEGDTEAKKAVGNLPKIEYAQIGNWEYSK